MTCKDDGYGLIWNVMSSLNIKVAFLLFITYIILNTDVFTENILYNISYDSYDKKNMRVTNKGFMITGLILIVIYLCLDLGDRSGVL